MPKNKFTEANFPTLGRAEKQNPKTWAENKAGDLANVVNKIGTYENSYITPDSNLVEKTLVRNEALLVSIDSAKENLNLPAEKMEELVNAINKATLAAAELADSPEEKSKIDLRAKKLVTELKNKKFNESPLVEAQTTAKDLVERLNNNEKTAEAIKNFVPLLTSNNKTIANSVESTLEKLNPQYLAQNNKEISEKLQKAANAKPPLMKRIAAKLGFKASTRDYAAENVNKLVAIFEQESKSYTNPNRFSVSPKQQTEKPPSLAAQKFVEHAKESAARGGTSVRSTTPKNLSKSQGKTEGQGR